jgi:alanyl-tRNA synthetase
MTTKLYDLNCNLQRFEATVLSCEGADGVFKVVLDQTAFFPEGGGQPADTGTLNGIAVTDVQETPAGIVHFASECIPAGTSVFGQIDWDKRFRRMQNHTGEHIISGIIDRLYGFSNVGFHIGSDTVTVDFDGFLTKDDLKKIELEANEIIIKNAPVTVEYPMPEVLTGLQYRSKINLTEGVRIVTVTGCDACACCAPHVASTGQVGIIKLLDAMRYKGGVRISMLCGFDALADYNEKCSSVAAVSALLSAKQKDIAAAVERTKEELAAAQRRNTEIKQRLIEIMIDTLKDTKGNICVFEPMFDMADLRKLATAGLDFCTGVFAAFSGSEQDGYQFVIGSSTVDLRERAKAINEAINGRGGGTTTMMQGGAAAGRAQIEAYFSKLVF